MSDGMVVAGSGSSCESGTYGVLDCVFALVPGEISQLRHSISPDAIWLFSNAGYR